MMMQQQQRDDEAKNSSCLLVLSLVCESERVRVLCRWAFGAALAANPPSSIHPTISISNPTLFNLHFGELNANEREREA